jgi:hypothetical protein
MINLLRLTLQGIDAFTEVSLINQKQTRIVINDQEIIQPIELPETKFEQ